MKIPSLFKKGIFFSAILLLLFSSSGCNYRSEEYYFKAADTHFEKGRFIKATEVYQEYLGAYPEGHYRDRAFFRKGEILYYALGKRAAAVATFSRLVEDFSNSEYSFLAREIMAGIFRDETQQYLRAVLEYRWLLNQRPKSKRADEYQFQIAHTYFLSNRLDQAISEFKKFTIAFPDSKRIEQAYDELGSAYLVLGQPRNSLEIFNFMIERFPESTLRSTIEFKIGGCYEELGRLYDALAQYQMVRKTYPNTVAVDIRIQGVQNRLKKKHGQSIISPSNPRRKK